jgi:hypothetical protein
LIAFRVTARLANRFGIIAPSHNSVHGLDDRISVGAGKPMASLKEGVSAAR